MPKKTNKIDSDDEPEFEDNADIEDDNNETEDSDYVSEELDDEEPDIEENLEDEEDEYIGDDEEIEINAEKDIEYISKENRISSNRLTKYEMVRILGERTKQLTMGAKPLVKNFQGLSYERIAEEELKKNMIPFKIKRPLPNGKFEIWTLDELYKEHLMSQLN